MSGLRVKKDLAIVLAGTLLLFALWTWAVLVSSRPLAGSLLLLGTQTFLSLVALLVLFKGAPRRGSVLGPGLMQVLAVHTLIFYGISNVVPALLPQTRPSSLLITTRIPEASVEAYSLATVAAALFLGGTFLGDRIAGQCLAVHMPKHSSQVRQGHYAWLPGYRVAFAATGVLLALVLLGTSLYGNRFSALMTDETITAGFPTSQRLLYHGLLPFLPIAPILAACAYVQATSRRGAKLSRWLLIVSSLLTFGAMTIWGMRSTAMLALFLPLWLLAYTGRISWVRTVVPAVSLAVVAYVVVTAVRFGDLTQLLSESGLPGLPIAQAASALGSRPTDVAVLGKTWFDASYRAAGLEAVAAVIDAQEQGRLELKWGRVTGSGILQALPASLRPEPSMPERVKTAPAYYGIFRQGDWVTTILAELILDFGPVLVLYPAILAGLLLSLIDRLLLWFGVRAGQQAFLILRIPWLVCMIQIGAGLADMTLLFFKGTIGYTVLFLILGLAVNARFQRSRAQPSLWTMCSQKDAAGHSRPV